MWRLPRFSRRDRHQPFAAPGSFLLFAQREPPTFESRIGTSLESGDIRLGEADRTDRSRLIALDRFGDRTVEQTRNDPSELSNSSSSPLTTTSLERLELGTRKTSALLRLGGREPRPYSTLMTVSGGGEGEGEGGGGEGGEERKEGGGGEGGGE